MRIDFKKPQIYLTKFFKFCKQNGANYFEDNCGVWIIPKKYGSNLIGIQLKEDGKVYLGEIDEDCGNFSDSYNQGYGDIFVKEQDWIIEIFTIFKKYKP